MKEWQQNCFPQHVLSRFMGKLANAKMGRLTQFAIKQFITQYQVNMTEAEITDYRQFDSFNAFFTRALKSDVRQMPADERALASPVDGCISELGVIKKDCLLQAKGSYYSVRDLCGGFDAIATPFENGAFLTAYLSPKDYHRFHMPISGVLEKMIYVPGKLFSVNQSSVRHVSNLFARNERVICLLKTEIGQVAVIAIGAMIVGSISTKWHGIVAPQKKRVVQQWDYSDKNIRFSRGEELGHFRLGSTVVVLCEAGKVRWTDSLQAESVLQLGQVIGFPAQNGT